MITSKDAIADVVETLKEHDFYQPRHAAIFRAILELYGRGEQPDSLTVASALESAGDLSRVGGRSYLSDLIDASPIAANASYYASIVHDKATLRRLVDAGVKVAQLGYNGLGEAPDIVDHAQQLIYEVADTGARQDYQLLRDLFEPTLDEMEAMSRMDGALKGVPTGFRRLDDLTNGLSGGQMIIIAARPGIGKSTLALDFARSAAIHHKKTAAFFSLEMSRVEIVMRLISAEAHVPLSTVRSGRLTDEDWKAVVAHTSEMSEAPLFIDDSANLTMMEIRAKARRLKQRHDLSFIVIDYLQLMSSGKKVESRQLEVSEFSRQIKLLAKELDIPIVALSQLNRGPETRKDRRPMLSDLRESGSLEQDADIVILLHREDYYDESVRPGEADLIVAKHRNGSTPTIPVVFQGKFSSFVDMPSD